MKKLFLMLCLVLGVSALTHAQVTKPTPEQKATLVTRMLTKKLNLSADQTAKINTIIMGRAIQMDSLQNNAANNSKKTNKQARKTLLLQTDEQLNTVLTPDQQKLYAQFKADRKEKAKARKDVFAPVKS